jgi:hypothetical protein
MISRGHCNGLGKDRNVLDADRLSVGRRAAAILFSSEIRKERLQFLTLGRLFEKKVRCFARIAGEIEELHRGIGGSFCESELLEIAFLIIVPSRAHVIQILPITLSDLKLGSETLSEHVRADRKAFTMGA